MNCIKFALGAQRWGQANSYYPTPSKQDNKKRKIWVHPEGIWAALIWAMCYFLYLTTCEIRSYARQLKAWARHSPVVTWSVTLYVTNGEWQSYIVLETQSAWPFPELLYLLYAQTIVWKITTMVTVSVQSLMIPKAIGACWRTTYWVWQLWFCLRWALLCISRNILKSFTWFTGIPNIWEFWQNCKTSWYTGYCW